MKTESRGFAVALTLGMLAGALIGRLSVGCRMGPRPPGWRIARFSAEMGLDARQKAAIKDILRVQRERLKALRLEARPKFDRLREETNSQIRVLLSPDQARRFDAFEAREREARQRERAERDRE